MHRVKEAMHEKGNKLREGGCFFLICTTKASQCHIGCDLTCNNTLFASKPLDSTHTPCTDSSSRLPKSDNWEHSGVRTPSNVI